MPNRTRLDKAAVLQAAVELVNEEGAAGLSLSRLANRLGIQTPSLYNHISSLAGLQRELAQINARAMGERLMDAAIGKTGRQALLAMAEGYRAYIKEFPGLYLISLRASGNQDSVDEELRAAEERAVRTGLAVIGSFGINGDDALHALRGFRSLVHGFATLEVSGGFGLPLDCDESFRRLITYFINGLEMTAAGVQSE
jgi:AcrR family transcriptional regulator